ncbi:MAG: DnaB-like helicase C-terminal domain-containing protein [Acidobacteriota bacterium]
MNPPRAERLTEAERWNLEARLQDRVLYGRDPAETLALLHASDFSHPGRRALWALLQRRNRAGLPVDSVAVLDTLQEEDPENILERLGGMGEIVGRIVADVVQAPDSAVEGWARTLRRASLGDRQRRLLQDLDRATAAGDFEGERIARGALEDLFGQIDALETAGPVGAAGVLEAPAEVWTRCLLEINRDMAAKSGPRGLGFGVSDLDEELRPGLRPGRLWVIGAGTGEGKTLLALQLALTAARAAVGCLYLSFEMTPEELLERAAVMEEAAPWWKVQRRTLTESEGKGLLAWEPPDGLLIVNAAGVPARRIPRMIQKARGRLERAGRPLGLVVVDHLQLVQSGGRTETRALEVKEVANLCKQVALDGAGGGALAVLALSQLRRAREAERPDLRDLKESGGIEEAADTVLLLHRKRAEGRMTDRAELRVAKNRGGRVGGEPLEIRLNTERARFE